MFNFFKRRPAPTQETEVAQEFGVASLKRYHRMLEQAQAALRAGRLDEADPLFVELRESMPDISLKGSAEIAFRRGDVAASRELWDQFIELFPRSPIGPFAVAGLLLAAKQWQEAMELCIRSEQAFPGEALFMLQMVNIVEACPEIRAEQLPIVRQKVDNMLVIQPHNPGLLHGLARLHLMVGNLEAARDTYYRIWDRNAFDKQVREAYDRLDAQIKVRDAARKQAGQSEPQAV